MEHLLFKAFLLAAVLTLFTILLTRKENSVTPINYLGTTGAASTKKLMVVDQTSGAISFLNDSVAGVNQKFLQNDATQAALLKELFGPNLDGAGGVFKAKIDELLAAGGPIASTYETKVLADDRLASLEGSIDSCIKNEQRIRIQSWHNGEWKMLGDDGCDHNLASPFAEWEDGKAKQADKAAWCSSMTKHPFQTIHAISGEYDGS